MFHTYVATTCSICFICFRYVASVLSGCYIYYNDYVASVCFKCFICFYHMLELFHLSVAKLDLNVGLFSEKERASAGAMVASAVSWQQRSTGGC
jgi:hypothetical protein